MQTVEYKSYFVFLAMVPFRSNLWRNGIIARNTEVAMEEEAEDYDWSIDWAEEPDEI